MGVYAQVAGVVMSLAAARQEKAVYEMEARSYEEQAETSAIQSRQEEEERRRQLRMQLASLGTSMSSQGVAIDPRQGSMGAIRKSEMDIAKKDIGSIKLMGMSNRRKYKISAASSRAAGKAAVTSSYAQAAMTLGSQSDPKDFGIGS